MPDLRDRFASLDDVRTPYLWHDIEARTATMRGPSIVISPVELVFATGILVLALIATATAGGSGPRLGTVTSPPPAPATCHVSTRATPAATTRSGDDRWVATGSLHGAREFHAAVLLRDGCVLVAGGAAGAVDASEILATAEIYDPSTGEWVTTGAMHTARRNFTATRLLDGRVLIAGGDRGPGDDPAIASAELYDPATGTWQTTGSMIEARYGASAVLLPDGRVLVVGGWRGRGDGVGMAELYDPASGTWTSAASMHGSGLVPLPDGRVIVLDRTTTQVYDPASGTWTEWPAEGDGYGMGAPAVLPNGTVLFVDGGPLTGPGANGSSHTILFDPTDGAWTAAPPTLRARLDTVVVVLADGSVLAIGGREHGAPDAEIFGDAERFDPATSSWVTAGTLTMPRSGHTAVLLPDGRVLVVGGTSTATEPGPALATAELYLPGG